MGMKKLQNFRTTQLEKFHLCLFLIFVLLCVCLPAQYVLKTHLNLKGQNYHNIKKIIQHTPPILSMLLLAISCENSATTDSYKAGMGKYANFKTGALFSLS